jgi:hypothetical protein
MAAEPNELPPLDVDITADDGDENETPQAAIDLE